MSSACRALAAALVSASFAGCLAATPPRPEPPRLLLRETGLGARPATAPVSVGGETRESLTATHAWKIALPGPSRLTFAVGVAWKGPGEPPGWATFVVSVDSQEVARERLNPRVAPDWKDVTIEVAGPAREAPVSFELRFTDAQGRDIDRPAGLTLAVAEPTLHDARAYGTSRGAILISIDTLRRDHVGLYGYPRPTTPFLDRLGLKGLVAEDAVSVSSWTLPSHLSMLTSVLPGAHGGTNGEKAFSRAVPTLPAILKRAGFATHAVTSHLYVSPAYGVDAGFDSMNFRQDRPASNVANHTMNLIDRYGDRPFFLFLHFYDPHWHYSPRPEVLRLFETEPYRGSITGNLKDFQNLRPGDLKAGDLQRILTLYDAEIRGVDDEIARLFGHLRERGLDKSTLVIVTSDHGEEFLDHGSWEHQKTLYEEVIRVPLVVTGPGVAPRREAKPVTLLDVAPTILEGLAIPGPESMRGVSVLRPLSESREQYGETEHTIDRRPIFFLRAGGASWKTILPARPENAGRGAPAAGDADLWFDLASDPREERSAPPRDDVRRSIESRGRSLFESSREGARPAPRVLLTAEQREQLRALGYIK